MKLRKPIVLISIILFLIAAYFFLIKDTGLLSHNINDIAIKDTSQIIKIVMSDQSKKNPGIEITRDSGVWKVNNKYPAEKQKIRYLLEILKHLEFVAPVPKEDIKSVKDSLLIAGVKVEIYSSNKKIKGFTIGDLSTQQLGNYLLSDNSEKPIIVNIPGRTESLLTVFKGNEFNWRNKTVFNYKHQEIKSVSLIYTTEKSKSFFITNPGDQNFELKDSENRIINQKTIGAITRYLTYFRQLDYFKVALFNEIQVDSIKEHQPEAMIKITDTEGKVLTIRTYPICHLMKPGDNKSRIDMNFLYAIVNDDRNVLIIKYFDIDPILKELDYFRK